MTCLMCGVRHASVRHFRLLACSICWDRLALVFLGPARAGRDNVPVDLSDEGLGLRGAR